MTQFEKFCSKQKFLQCYWIFHNKTLPKYEASEDSTLAHLTIWSLRSWESSEVNCYLSSVQFSSVAQSCPTLCDPMNRSTPGLPVHHQLPEFTQTQRPSSQWCHPAISSSVVPFSSCPQSLPASESSPVSQLFSWGGQSTGVSALASFLPRNTQGWSSVLELTKKFFIWLIR